MKPDKPQALLFVDGYNIVGAWTDLKKIRDRHGLEEARHRLVDHLTGFSAYNAYNSKIVFDSQYRDGGSTEQVISEFLAIHYTNHGETADTFIEKSCANFRHAADGRWHRHCHAALPRGGRHAGPAV